MAMREFAANVELAFVRSDLQPALAAATKGADGRLDEVIERTAQQLRLSGHAACEAILSAPEAPAWARNAANRWLEKHETGVAPAGQDYVI